MRIRIIRPRQGEVDGVPLNTFQVGSTYDVSTSLATYLVMSGSAEPLIDERPAVVFPINDVKVPVNPVDAAAVAADKGEPTEPDPRHSGPDMQRRYRG